MQAKPISHHKVTMHVGTDRALLYLSVINWLSSDKSS